MTFLKKLLLTLFSFHIFCTLLVNFFSFSNFNSHDINSLNKFGEGYISLIKALSFKSNSVSFYTNFTGTNRGYEFFSPNVANKKLKLKFVDQNGHEIRLYKSFESKMKFGTASYFINSGNVSQALRQKMMVSYCKRIFALNDNVSVIHIILTLQQNKPLYDEINNAPLKTVELYTVHRL